MLKVFDRVRPFACARGTDRCLPGQFRNGTQNICAGREERGTLLRAHIPPNPNNFN